MSEFALIFFSSFIISLLFFLVEVPLFIHLALHISFLFFLGEGGGNGGGNPLCRISNSTRLSPSARMRNFIRFDR